MSFSGSPIMIPLSAIYRAITHARLAAYGRGLLQIAKLPATVISVGNLTTGGTGKTPLVEWVCRQLAQDGLRVCVLTRGYGRTNPKSQVVVSDGTRVLAEQPESGDEPYLLAQNLIGLAAVVCNSDRRAAGDWASKNLGTQVFVLDDGFQHLRVARDLNIAVIDATDPWGGGALLPKGRLREPAKGLGRADCVVLTRTDQAEELSRLIAAVEKNAVGVPVFTSRMVTTRIRNLVGDWIETPSQPIGAFCGVGNSQSFFNHLRREGHELAFTRAYADHHVFEQTDIDEVVRAAAANGAKGLITTAKDATKLGRLKLKLPCYVLEIEISIDDEARLLGLIRGVIAAAR